jgi:hypothetical protein
MDCGWKLCDPCIVDGGNTAFNTSLPRHLKGPLVHQNASANPDKRNTMNILTHLLFASSLLFNNNLEATANASHAAFAGGETPRSEQAVEASRDVLTEALRDHVGFPQFADPMQAAPIQEVIVRIQFQVDENNRLDLIKVSGNDRRVVDYVQEHLQGKELTEEPVLSGVTFATTLRFVY